jgi:hypothetical protein
MASGPLGTTRIACEHGTSMPLILPIDNPRHGPRGSGFETAKKVRASRRNCASSRGTRVLIAARRSLQTKGVMKHKTLPGPFRAVISLVTGGWIEPSAAVLHEYVGRTRTPTFLFTDNVWSAARQQGEVWSRRQVCANVFGLYVEIFSPGHDELRAYPSL